MSTRSRISILNKDGTGRSIYCHWDGYLSNNGAILNSYYKDEETINKLMDLGDLSSLGYTPVSCKEYWTDPAGFRGKHPTVAYRDRGDNCPAYSYKDEKALFAGIDYSKEVCNYLFIDGVWYYFENYIEDMRRVDVKLSDIDTDGLTLDEMVACYSNPAALNSK